MNVHLKFPLAESQKALGYFSATRHIGQCYGEEVGQERDSGGNWLPLK